MADRHGSGGRQKYLVAAICIFGVSTSPLFYKLAYATGMHALWVNVFRLLITTVIMAAVTLISPTHRREIRQMSKRAFWLSALAGTLLALHLNSWALALVYTDTFAASTIIGTYVLLTVLFASLILKERTSKGALMGLILATVGVVVCNFGGGLGRLGGNMLALFAAVTDALYMLCGRKVRRATGAVVYTTVLYTFALFWMVVMALIAGVPATIPAEGVFWAGMLTIFSTLLGHSMASVALKHFKAATVSAIMMTGAIFGPLIVVLFMQDSPTPFTLVGGTIIIAGFVLYLIMERRETKRVEQTVTPAADL
jgi:drug/metabolite transporter (DMT)-like permease